MKKRHILYGVIFLVPLITYLLFMAINGNVKLDYELKIKDHENYGTTYQVVEMEDEVQIYDDWGTIEFIKGKVVYLNNVYGVVLKEDDFVKINNKFYTADYNNKENKLELIEITKKRMVKEESYKFSMAFIISVAGVVIVSAIISGKLEIFKKQPMVAIAISLITGTIILYIINTIVSSLLAVFTIATAEWLVITGIDIYLNFKDKKDDDNKLIEEAMQDERIKSIIKSELERKIDKL